MKIICKVKKKFLICVLILTLVMGTVPGLPGISPITTKAATLPSGGIDTFIDAGNGQTSELYLSKHTIDSIDEILNMNSPFSSATKVSEFFIKRLVSDESVKKMIGDIGKLVGIAEDITRQMLIQVVLYDAVGDYMSSADIIAVSLYLEAFNSTSDIPARVWNVIKSIAKQDVIAAWWNFVLLFSNPNFSWNYINNQGQSNGVVIPVDLVPLLRLSDAKQQEKSPFTEWDFVKGSITMQGIQGIYAHGTPTANAQVRNTGLRQLKGVKASIISGQNYFEVDSSTLIVGSNPASIKVRTKLGAHLDNAGTYNGILRVTTGNGEPKYKDIPIILNVQNTSWAVDVQTTVAEPLELKSTYVGYATDQSNKTQFNSNVSNHSIHVINNGSSDLRNVYARMETGGEYFDLFGALTIREPGQQGDVFHGAHIGAGKTEKFQIRPVVGLQPGTYKGSIKITTSTDSSLVLYVYVSFTVLPHPNPGVVVGIVSGAGIGIENAYVTLINLDTGERRIAVTDANGEYQFIEVKNGVYRILATKDSYSSEMESSFDNGDYIAGGIRNIFEVNNDGHVLDFFLDSFSPFRRDRVLLVNLVGLPSSDMGDTTIKIGTKYLNYFKGFPQYHLDSLSRADSVGRLTASFGSTSFSFDITADDYVNGVAIRTVDFTKRSFFWLTNDGTVYPEITILTPGDSFVLLPEATRPGYDFQGWFTAHTGGTQITNESIVPSSSTQYYARWTKAETDIVYGDLDGSGGEPDSVDLVHMLKCLAIPDYINSDKIKNPAAANMNGDEFIADSVDLVLLMRLIAGWDTP